MTLRLAPKDIVAQSTSPLLAIADWWERCRLGDLAAVTNGAAFKSARFNTLEDGLPLIRIRDVGRLKASTYYSGDYEDRHLVESGDLLIGMDGDFRIARWTGGRALLNQRVCRLRVRDSDLYCDRFLEYVLQPYLDEVHKVTSSVTVKHLSSRTVTDLPIPLPPRGEQKRIVAAIDEHLSRLDAASDAITAAQARIQASRRSVLAEAFTGQLAPQNPTDEPASVLLDRIAVDRRTEPADRQTSPRSGRMTNDLPPSWATTTLGDVFEIVGGSTPRTGNPDFWDGDIPWLTPDDLSGHDDVLISRGRRSITNDGFESTSTHMLPTGSILFTSRAPIGYTAIAANPLCTNQGFKSLVPPAGVASHYVYWYLRYSTPQIRELGSGTTFKEMSKKRMAAVPFILPPSPEQERIVAAIEEHFSRLDAASDAITAAQARIQASRRSVLAEAFRGRLASQDPIDEPASVLLERVERSCPAKPRPRKANR